MLWQEHCDADGRRIVMEIAGAYTTFYQEEGMLVQKHRNRNRCIVMLFKSLGVRGRFGSPEL